MRYAPPALMILCFAASAAWADGPISTATRVEAPPAAGSPPPLGEADRVQGPEIDADAPVRMGPCGPARVTADGKPDQSIRGEVGVGVGTGGYREMDLAACKPMGDSGSIAVSIDQTQGDRGWRR